MKKRLSITTLALLALASVACPGPRDGSGGTRAARGNQDPPADGYFRWRLRENPPDLDPAQSTDTTSAAVMLRVMDGLLEFKTVETADGGTTMEIAPSVAESWKIRPDGLVYDFTLRDNVYFHNGRKVTAEDVSYSFHRTLEPELNSERQWVLSNIAGAQAYIDGEADTVRGIEVVSPTHVRLTLDEPFAPFLGLLCMEAASIIPREVYEDPERGYLRRPVGCGPFMLEEWQQSNFLKIKAFPQYYRGEPKLKGIKFRFIENMNTALLEYRNGGLELLDEVPPGQRKRCIDELPGQYKLWPQLGVYYYGFNHQKPPFAGNKKLRQAFNHAVNREYICETLQEGKDRPAYGIMPPGLPGHRPESAEDPYDPEKARQLLAQAGYPGGEGLPEIVLHFNTNEGHQRVAQRIQSDLKKIGVNITLDNTDWATYLDLVEGTAEEAPDIALYRMGWIADYPDPDNFMTVRLSREYFGPMGNYSRFHDEKFERLIAMARKLTNMDRRIPLYQQAERIAVDEACWLFIYYYGEEALIKPYVQDFDYTPQGDFAASMWNVSFAETAPASM